MLAVLDEKVVSYPVALFGHRPNFGHAGVRGWWAAMEASHDRYDVVVTEIRQIESDSLAVLESQAVATHPGCSVCGDCCSASATA
jgi:hypothetical protein